MGISHTSLVSMMTTAPRRPEERLAVYRAVRDASSVPSEAGFFLIAWMLDVLRTRVQRKDSAGLSK